jgi:hypothetical protein
MMDSLAGQVIATIEAGWPVLVGLFAALGFIIAPLQSQSSRARRGTHA